MPTKTDYLLVGIGAFAAVLLTSYVPSLMKVMSASSPMDERANCPGCRERHYTTPGMTPPYMSIESVPGIDLQSLNTVRYMFP